MDGLVEKIVAFTLLEGAILSEMAAIVDQRQIFDRFCKERYEDRGDQTSKTMTTEKGRKIILVLKSDPSAADYSSQLKFWVKKRGFQLVNYAPLGLKDVLCLPARKKVSYVYKL